MLPLSLAASLAASLLALPTPALASTPVSWHLPLVGLPSSSSLASSSPHTRFQPTGKGSNVLVVSTESHVLAAVQPQDGSLIWRRKYDEAQLPILHLAAGEDTLLAWTSPSASDLHAISTATGKLLWSLDPEEDACGGEEAKVLVAPQAEEGVVVQCGGLSRRLDVKTGEIRQELQASSTPLGTAFNDDHVATFGINGKHKITMDLASSADASSSSTLTSHFTSSPPSSGSLALAFSYRDFAGKDVSTFAIVWPDKRAIRGAQKHRDGFEPHDLMSMPFVVGRLVNVGLAQMGVFIALSEKEDSALVVCHVDGAMRRCGQFSLSPSAPPLASYVDTEGGLHIAYLDHSNVLQLASLQIWSRTKDIPLGLISAHSFPLGKDEFDGMHGFALQVLPLPSGSKSIAPALSRVAVWTASGALQVWEGDRLQWTREEGLATAEIGPVAVKEAVKKITAHISDDDNLPSFVFASSTTRSIYALSPVGDTFSVAWKYTAPAGAFVRWKTVDAVRLWAETEEQAWAITGEPVLEVVWEEEDGVVAERTYVDLRTGRQMVGRPAGLGSVAVLIDDALTVRLKTVGERTLVAQSARDASPVWTFSLPPGQAIKQVSAQVPPSTVPGPTHQSTTLLAVLTSTSSSASGSSTLFLLHAETGALVHQFPDVDSALITWDVSLPGWEVVASRGSEGGESKIRVYKLKPTRSSSISLPSLQITAHDLGLPGQLRPLGLSLTPLRLAQPCLLALDQLHRLAAYPLRYLEALAAGRPAAPGLPWTLSPGRELFSSPSSSHLSLSGPHPLSPSISERASDAIVWLFGGGGDVLASVFAPSRSFDRLGEEFNKQQMGVVVGVLAVALVGTRAWAASQRTKQLWLE
ncbi:hypothetical protein JCM8097_002655 [Rhodosporidiobolus ruineniae]